MSTQNPLVSIVIPTYNGAQFIDEAMASAIVQSYQNLEIVISDDASTDGTLAIIESYRERTSIPIKIYNHNPSGIGANWNNSIKHAKGEYIKFLFQDDVLLPNCVERMVSIAESASNVGLVYCKREIIYEESNPFDRRWVKNFKILHQSWKSLIVEEGVMSGRLYIKDPNLLIHPVNKIGEPPAVLLHKSCFEKIGYFNTQLKQALDIEYWYRIMSHFNIGFADEALIKFRIHGNQASQINAKSGFNDKRLMPVLQFKYLFWYLPLSSKMQLLREIWHLTDVGTFFRKVGRKLKSYKFFI